MEPVAPCSTDVTRPEGFVESDSTFGLPEMNDSSSGKPSSRISDSSSDSTSVWTSLPELDASVDHREHDSRTLSRPTPLFEQLEGLLGLL